ncbi:hypothetical protein JXA84_09965 [candidate division WOR-3 bacterium]|nr:hypothetical protein [candidate division WOR-3 bacterium]
MDLANLAIMAGLILIVIGMPRLIIGFFHWTKDKKLLKSGARAQARIVESTTYPNDNTVNTGQHRFVAEFIDGKGKTYYSKSRFASRKPETFINRTITVVYDEKNPENNRFLNDISLIREIVEYSVVFLIGMALAVFGFLT